MKKPILASITALLIASPYVQATMQPGGLLLMEKCPGDTFETKATGNEALLQTLLTPLLTGIVSSGFKLAGEKLKEQAAEAQVDILHKGAHFYTWRQSTAAGDPQFWDVSAWCLVIASKQTKSTRQTVDTFLEGYKAYTVAVSGDGNRSLNNPADGKADLITELGKLGFSNTTTPGLLAVLDVQVSAQKSEFRLSPRFVVMDHSIREKRTDKRRRDMTFEFSYSVPGVADAVAKGLLKMEGLLINSAIVQDPADPPITSHWMPLPALNDVEKTRTSERATLKTQQKTHEQSAGLAASAAKLLGANDWIDPTSNVKWAPVELNLSCPAIQNIEPGWRKAHALLQEESTKAKPSAVLAGRWTNLVTYFESCGKSQGAKKKLTETATAVGSLARSYDLTVALKEFRDRPVSRFFGEILADDDTRKELTTGIVAAIDPATREAKAKADAEARVLLLKAYESAVLTAEASMLAYESAKPEEKAAKLLQMKHNQRAANRAAEAVQIALPYPDAGTWFGL